MRETRSTCPYCGVGCGVVAKGGAIEGDVDHPANFGRLCSKGAALQETLALPERLLAPQVMGRETDWDEALDFIASQFIDIREKHGPDAIAFYVSGQFLTEDYYIANKLMKGFIGSSNIDTNSRLCMASAVAGHTRAFGEDIVPGCYEDLDEADLIVLVGGNMAWCHPVLYQRIVAAREKRGSKLVIIDPRRTPSAETADLHLALAAGCDALLFNGLLNHLAKAGALNRQWIAAHTSGFDDALAAAESSAPTLDLVAARTGLAAPDLARFYDLFAREERVVTLYSQGINQSSSGADNVNAILNCHLATRRLGRPGMGPFSLTGQPNAMGGREVGGLANQLAAHMAFTPEDIDRVGRFWNAPNMARSPGLKAVDLFEAIADGEVRAVWIAATNPAASMPRADRVRAALDQCPLVIASDAWPTDTTARAHIVLPAATWPEKNGVVTNSERCMSRQRAFREAPGLARPDWQIFSDVGRRMGWESQFNYTRPADVFREHAALSAFENGGSRIFNIGGLADIDDAAYDDFTPRQWPFPKPDYAIASGRLFGNGGFPTPDGRARMIPIIIRMDPSEADYPLRLNTGRVRDQWHTMTRTGRVARLMTHSPGPTVSIHPGDAHRLGLEPDGLARVESEHGHATLRVVVSDTMRPGEIFAPMHWTDQFTSAGPIARLVHARVDPVSGQPDLKGARVRVSAVREKWRGLLMRRASGVLDLGKEAYWSKAPVAHGFAFELAGWTPLNDLLDSEAALRRLLAVPPQAELVSFSDPSRCEFRYAGLIDGRLDACVFFGPKKSVFAARDKIDRLLGSVIAPLDRQALLATREAGAAPSRGKMICACFAVGEDLIAAAIREHGFKTPMEIGAALRAGTNCGSCVPELQKLLAARSEERAPTG